MLEDEITTLRLSVTLKELGILLQNGALYYWHNIDTPMPSIVPSTYIPERSDDFLVPAFTMSQLLSFLPAHIMTKEEPPFNTYSFHLRMQTLYINSNFTKVCCVNYYGNTYSANELTNPFLVRKLLVHDLHDENCANALARLLCHLKENDLT